MTKARTILPLPDGSLGPAEMHDIERAICASPGVLAVVVGHPHGFAAVDFDAELTDPNAIFGMLRARGYARPNRVAVRAGRAWGRHHPLAGSW